MWPILGGKVSQLELCASKANTVPSDGGKISFTVAAVSMESGIDNEPGQCQG